MILLLKIVIQRNGFNTLYLVVPSDQGPPNSKRSLVGPKLNPLKWVTVGGKTNGTRVFLEVTDTAGQEAFVAIRDHYITNGDGFLLVYAINDEQSFKQLDSIR